MTFELFTLRTYTNARSSHLFLPCMLGSHVVWTSLSMVSLLSVVVSLLSMVVCLVIWLV